MAFSYYANIPANYSSDGEQTNYQMKLAIVKGSGSNSAGIIYLNNHAENWPYDIQFKNAAGTVMDYWREEYDATDMTVWVECDSIAASGETDFYVYYGDSGVGDASDGDSSFIFFDHFTSLDSDIWDTPYGSPDIVNSTWVRFESGSGVNDGIRTKNTVVTAGSMSRIDLLVDCVTINSDGSCGMTSGYYPRLCDASNNTIAGFAWYKEGAYDRHVWRNGAGTTFPGINRGVLTGRLIRNSWLITSSTQKQSCEGSINFTNDEFSGTSGLGTYSMKMLLGAPSESYVNDVRIDWILIRKVTTNEPTWATPGSETATSLPTKLYSTYLSVAGITESSSYTKVKFMSDGTIHIPELVEDSGGIAMKIYADKLKVKEIREAS
jgi:hypothetical protein